METAQVGDEGREERGGTVRETVRDIARHRIGRRARRAVRGRVKSFERGARFGYVLRDNPRRALLAIFGLGAVIGAIAVTLAAIGGEYSDSLEEGLEEDMPEGATAAA